MEPQQIAETDKCESSYDLWAKIRENHEGAESNLSSQALADFLSFRYRKNESVNSFEIALSMLSLTTGIDRKSEPNFEKTNLWVLSNTLPEHMQVVLRIFFSMAKLNGTAAGLISRLEINLEFFLESEPTKESSAFLAQDSSKNRKYYDQRPSKTYRFNNRKKPYPVPTARKITMSGKIAVKESVITSRENSSPTTINSPIISKITRSTQANQDPIMWCQMNSPEGSIPGS